jgi:hypothetical protein
MNILKEIYYKFKVRALRVAISKITVARRELNDKQKQLTKSVDKYTELHKSVSKL